MLSKRTAGMFAVALVFLVLGCSGDKSSAKKGEANGGEPKSEKITGTVKYDGKLVPIGTINFIPEKGKPVPADIEDGKYTAHVPSGKFTVTVDTITAKKEIGNLEEMIKTGPPKLPKPPQGAPAPPDMENVMKQQMAKWKERLEKLKKMVEVPAVYADAKMSGLSLTVEPGAKEFNIDLKKP